MDNKKQFNGGLTESKRDVRDFSHSKVFGQIDIGQIPDNFMVSEPLEIKQQYDSDQCVAFSCCALSEAQENVLLSPEWFFYKMKNGDTSWGADLRTGCRTAVNVGFIEQKDAPYTLKEYTSKDLVLATWSESLDEKAKEHKKISYFKVDGYENTFDAFQSTLWQNRMEQRLILTGVNWCREWTHSNGIINEMGTSSFGHAFSIIGKKTIDNKEYLIAQLSNGNIGEKGLFYFERSIVNEAFTFGAYTFKDMPPKVASTISWSWWQKLLHLIKRYGKW